MKEKAASYGRIDTPKPMNTIVVSDRKWVRLPGTNIEVCHTLPEPIAMSYREVEHEQE